MTPCFECGRAARCHHHVVPRSKGGTRTVPLCAACHGKVHGIRAMAHGELTRLALQAMRRRGERTGSVPYGKRVGADGRLEIDPSEQEVVALVLQLKAQGLAIRTIADELNRRAIPARGSRWHHTTIQRILKSKPTDE